MTGIAFDHVSIGVKNGERTLADLRESLGSTPVAGERLPYFRYVLNRAGDANRGMQFELIEEQGGEASFMHRFLERHGEGAHHLTFTVPNVEVTIEEIRRAGWRVVQVDLEHPPWREAFIMPTEPGLGIVIQIADTTKAYPPMSELLAAPPANPESLPHNRGGQDRYWWNEVRQTVAPGPIAYLHRVELQSEHARRVIELLTGPLRGDLGAMDDRGDVDIRWGEALIRVVPAAESGVRSLFFHGGPEEEVEVGSVRLLREDLEDAEPGGRATDPSARHEERL